MSTSDRSLTPRERRRLARQAKVLDTALEIIGEDGLEALTIEGIAVRMGASVGGLYRYYSSKAAILAALQRRALEGYADDLAATLERARHVLPQDWPEGHRALLEALVAFILYLEEAQRAPQRHLLFDATLSSPTQLFQDGEIADTEQPIQMVVQRCAGLLERAADLGALPVGDALQRTHVLWALLHGLDHFRKRDRFQPEPLRVDALLHNALCALLIGWGADPALARAVIDALDDVRRVLFPAVA